MDTVETQQVRYEFAERIRRLRAERGLTQEEAAEALDVATGTYAAWEQGKSAPRLEGLLALADYYDTSTDYLLERVEPIPSCLEERGVRWRLAWSEPRPEHVVAADILHRLIKGDSINAVARSLDVGPNDVERCVRDLVFHDRVSIQQVGRDDQLEAQIKQYVRRRYDGFVPRDVRVATLGHIHSRLVRFVLLGHVAKEYFREKVRPGDSVGLCGGFAVSRMLYALERGECPAGIRVLPVAVSPVFEMADVSANSLVGALAYRHHGLGVAARELPVTFEDSADQQLSPSRRIANRILEEARTVDFVFMGAGAPGTGALAKDIADERGDYLWLAGIDLSEIQERSNPVGNILYHLVDEEGSPLPDFQERNEQLVCSIGLGGLKRLVNAGKRVVLIALGADKAKVTSAAIQGGYANVLIVDDDLAHALLSADTTDQPDGSTRHGQ